MQVLGGQSLAHYFVLGLQLNDLHALVKLEVAISTAHTSVQQFVEIDEAVIAADAHLNHCLLHLTVRSV